MKSLLFKSIFFVVFTMIVPLSSQLIAQRDSVPSPVQFVSYFFENGTPLFWEYNRDGSVTVRLLYDHERSTPNRASNHWHFRVHAPAGSDVVLIMDFFPEVWNGRQVASYSLVKNYYISADGKNWKLLPAEPNENKGHKLRLHMDSDIMYVAGMEPYRISDLEKLYNEIKDNPLVQIRPIGKTVEGRQLEIVRIGKESAPYRIFIRARAHPWEAGGNWVVQGLIKSLLEKDMKALPYLDRYCVYILPMANKDGVARGMTRFNTMGRDLNRGQNIPADPAVSAENYAEESWLKEMTARGLKPNVSIDLHNDRNGRLSFGRSSGERREQYESNTKRFEALMYKYTWYTWYDSRTKTRLDATNSASYNVPRYNVDISGTLELNQTWIAGLNKEPFGKDWELMGRQLRDVFYYYFGDK